MFSELSLSHHAPPGVSTISVDPLASDGEVYLRYDGVVGVTLSDEEQVRAVNLVRNCGSPALAGNYLVNVMPNRSFFYIRTTSSSPGGRYFPSLALSRS